MSEEIPVYSDKQPHQSRPKRGGPRPGAGRPKNSAEQAANGRPSKWLPEFAAQAEKLCRLGATDAEIADFFNISESTLNNWKKRHPEFLESLKRGKVEADAEVAEKLYRRANGYSHDAVKIFIHEGQPIQVPYTQHYPPDTTACIFWLKNRQPSKWREKMEIEARDVTNETPEDKADREAAYQRAINNAALGKEKMLSRAKDLKP